jgi:hypothetical protein
MNFQRVDGRCRRFIPKEKLPIAKQIRRFMEFMTSLEALPKKRNFVSTVNRTRATSMWPLPSLSYPVTSREFRATSLTLQEMKLTAKGKMYKMFSSTSKYEYLI